MGLDIKLPIGLMFVVFGLLLTGFGLFTNNHEMYVQSLNININLFSGLFMLAFGGVMLAFVKRKKGSVLPPIEDEME